ncbi:hypothetical protein NPIL_81501 [Nephila pilipes]|uniref:Uncharacterized protein n=1 Tax=Nephila pilipes TaxID=299642 RepID=A0A8X6TC77_NEPPI|nr:hypothetical protein NPIL_81501 [Nephila pilipes]
MNKSTFCIYYPHISLEHTHSPPTLFFSRPSDSIDEGPHLRPSMLTVDQRHKYHICSRQRLRAHYGFLEREFPLVFKMGSLAVYTPHWPVHFLSRTLIAISYRLHPEYDIRLNRRKILRLGYYQVNELDFLRAFLNSGGSTEALISITLVLERPPMFCRPLNTIKYNEQSGSRISRRKRCLKHTQQIVDNLAYNPYFHYQHLS